MCQRCNYSQLLDLRGIDPTPNRLRIIEVIGNNSSPIGAREILAVLRSKTQINRVTVYRILDLLVKNGVVQQISGWGKGLFYGMAASENHPAHPHFHCNSCGTLQCMQPVSLQVNIKNIDRSFVGEISGMEVRLSGICRNCLSKKKQRRTKKEKS
jgi:Fur family ferric uptake transcriptional regulator